MKKTPEEIWVELLELFDRNGQDPQRIDPTTPLRGLSNGGLGYNNDSLQLFLTGFVTAHFHEQPPIRANEVQTAGDIADLVEARQP